MQNTFHSIIIGFGKGGKTLAAFLAGKGLKVALVEKSEKMYGGTCINKACIPTKNLENAASKVREDHLTDKVTLQKRYETAIDKKEELITKLRMANYNKLNGNEHITVFTGMASFRDAHTVEVTTQSGEKISLQGTHIFINTGSKSFIPSIRGIEVNDRVLTSENLMSLTTLPKKLTIIGAGFIGLEFAGIYSGFGSEVTVINTKSTILPREDEEDAEEVMRILQSRNVQFLHDVEIEEVQTENQFAKIVYTQDGTHQELISDFVLVATGRVANTDGLALEKAGVELDDRGFIKVSETLQTTQSHIWALGDVNGGPQFTYISLDDYRIIVNQLFGNQTRSTVDRKNVPSALFLDPAFARVGLNVKEAKAKGHQILVAKMATNAIPRAKQIGKTDGFIKIVIDKETEKILGATLICEGASEIIHLIQLAMDLGAPYTYLRDRIYAHPTMTEALNEVLSPAMIKEV